MMGTVTRTGSQAGYSALELLVTLGIFGTLASMAAVQIGVARPSFVGDGALRQVVAQLNIARERALTERRNMRVEFVGTNQIRLTRQEVPAGTTVLTTVDIESGVVYGLTPSVPDTPDVFGNAQGIDLGAATQYWVTNDRTLTHPNASPLSG